MRRFALDKVYQLIEPGPVVLLATSQRGRPNVMTMSWHMMVEFTPPQIACIVSNRNHSFTALRRTKETVASELPPKQEQVLSVELSPAHRRLYDKQLAAERKQVLGLVDDLKRNRITILASLTRLRQLALSPALVLSFGPVALACADASTQTPKAAAETRVVKSFLFMMLLDSRIWRHFPLNVERDRRICVPHVVCFAF